MSQYADDTLVILDGTEQSLQHCIEEMNNFYMLSGLKINLKKHKQYGSEAKSIQMKDYCIE